MDKASTQQTAEKLRIDVDSVVKSRAPGYYKFMPRGLIRWLERTICQDGLNDLLDRFGDLRDADFCEAVLKDLGIKLEVYGMENLPPVDNRRVLFVSNHPLGGLDGMALIDFIHSVYGGKLGFVVNDLLSAVKPLSGVFLPVNKHGAQSRQAVKAVDEAFASDMPMVMFPAGLVSRRGKKGVIKDLEWQRMFVAKAVKSGRDVIPLHFCGENSSFFYKFAKFRKRLGLKFNVEMIYLPREVFRSRGKTFQLVIGMPIPCHSLVQQGETPAQTAARVREMVYDLHPSGEPDLTRG